MKVLWLYRGLAEIQHLFFYYNLETKTYSNLETTVIEKKLRFSHKPNSIGKLLLKRQQTKLSFIQILMWLVNKHVVNQVSSNEVTSLTNVLQQVLKICNFLYICLHFQTAPMMKIICVTSSFIRDTKVCRNRKVWLMDGKLHIFSCEAGITGHTVKFIVTVIEKLKTEYRKRKRSI